jgi:glycerophosphoryl diester phosphodiesterase
LGYASQVDYWRREVGPLLYAHRGARVEYPENSLPAFEAALAQGADVLELDVHMSRDGVPVVHHDPTGAHSAGVRRELRHCTLEELRAWDIGRDPAVPVRLPTLAEVLEQLPDAPLNVDLKQAEPDMTGAVLRLIAEHSAESRVLLTSFSAVLLERVRRAGYAGPIGLSQRDAFVACFAPVAFLRRFPLAGVRLQIPPRYGLLDLTRRGLIAKLHRAGLAVDYWVINDRAQAQVLLERGADGIVTDAPRVMAPLFASVAEAAGWRARHPELARSAPGE